MKIELININKSFDQKHVLKNISFSITGGKSLGLLGRNGAGKTTTIRILTNIFSADSGDILVHGEKINYDKVQIGYLPEERGLYPKIKVIDQLIYFARLKGLKRKEAIQSIDYWLDTLHMQEYRNKRLSTLSKGNQQKIQLITAIAVNPDIVILDEPFSGLDPVNAILLKEAVFEIIKKGKIVIFSSHQMSYIEEFCDDIAILKNGEIVLQGNLKEIIRSYPRSKLVVKSDCNQKICDEISLESQIEKDELIITLPSPDDKAAVMKMLCDAYSVDAIRVYEPSLNDIFVEYTQDNTQGD
ncbi:MAG: ATP-binding cassette domain-containing protein [Spirochaetales bacterium]